MDTDQKVALLIHESVYAFQETKEVQKFIGFDSSGKPLLGHGPGQSSVGARRITGYLFTQDLGKLGRGGLVRVMFNESRLFDLLNGSRGNIVSVESKALSSYLISNSISIYSAGFAYYGEVGGASSHYELKAICAKTFALYIPDIQRVVDSSISLMENPDLGVTPDVGYDAVAVGGSVDSCINSLDQLKDVLP